VLKSDIGGTVTHGESVRATCRTLAELSNGLGSEGCVVRDHGLVGDRSIIRPGQGRTAVILEVLANTGKILDDLDALRLEVLGAGDTTALEDLRSVDGTSRQDDLTLGLDGLDITTGDGAELDGRRLAGVLGGDEARDLVLDKEIEVGEGVGDSGVVANAGVGSRDFLGVLGGGHPADAMLVAIVAGLGSVEAELLVRLPTNLWGSHESASSLLPRN
jgi:hypothetical protein